MTEVGKNKNIFVKYVQRYTGTATRFAAIAAIHENQDGEVCNYIRNFM
jgi:hypothetical protein